MAQGDLERARELARSYREDIARDAAGLLRIPSVAPDDGSPSPEIARALDYVGELASRLGLEYRDLDGKAAVVEYGSGDESLGVLLHLDVVPAGDGWERDPFGGEVVDGYVWGRGAIDDKGPAVSALYALAALKDAGITLNKRVKLVFATDEEGGEWRSMAHYLEREGAPTMSIVPDAEFPIINGEKGFCDITVTSSHAGTGARGAYDIVLFKGGLRSNMVPDSAQAVLSANGDSDAAYNELSAAAERYNAANEGARLSVERTGDGRFAVSAAGRSAHGSTPELGHNAAADVARYLASIDASDGPARELARFVADRIGKETDGRALGIYAHHDFLGDTTANLGIVYADEKEARAVVNVRFPYGITKEELPERVRASAQGYDVAVSTDGRSLDPLYVDPSDPLVTSLQRAYTSVTGQPAELKSIGGTTFAKAVPHAVSFGPLMPGEVEYAHQPNERVAVDALVRNAEIYAAAIYELAGK